MINKPGQDMRRSFWRADAWAAARAEKPARWHTPYPENPLFSRIMVGFLLFASLLNGVAAFAMCFGFFLALAVVGNLLRRVLMYWSIRRYGPWREMAPEMQQVLDNPSDLAARPASFASLPRGFTSPADDPAQQRGRSATAADYVLAIAGLFAINLLLVTFW